MVAKEMLSDVIPALKTSDTGLTALNWMDIFKVTHLPIVNDKEFLGLISENDIYDLNMPEEPLGNHYLSLLRPYVLDSQHVFEIMEIASRLKLSLVPVLDPKKNYLGVISLTDLLHYFAELSALKNPGGIIVIELNQNDYSFAQIAQIIEGNDAKILGAFITSNPNSVKMELTLKLNVTDLTSIKQTFYRYNYTVLGSYMKHDDEEDLLEDRLNNLLKYLNI
ncbi:MAG TPA: CBS domain-containing protein [Tenuifilaceae bacterium]|nr:CBS domain-containing protein [Tenuifilaceae bacterium]HPE19080.1 CBS domain-containing protein [Tenuifilaceae bacterium]HPJ45368.1 CBS domain-containing protein [Tenuifilaceae bacterium]HPQ33609.1 CBS domain-containing protein [Tenuifilaceae bacterium]HRX68747.1 CBS domain-containing protein [Tenuifilaceae bacterium]